MSTLSPGRHARPLDAQLEPAGRHRATSGPTTATLPISPSTGRHRSDTRSTRRERRLWREHGYLATNPGLRSVEPATQTLARVREEAVVAGLRLTRVPVPH